MDKLSFNNTNLLNFFFDKYYKIYLNYLLILRNANRRRPEYSVVTNYICLK